MFKRFVLLVGAVCIFVTVLNALVGFWVVGVLVLGGFLYALFKNFFVGMLVAAVAIGNMPMDGSWLLWALTLFASLGLFIFGAVDLYEKQVPNRGGTWPGISLVLVSLSLPIIGLALVQYLVETDRSIGSGVIALVILVGLGWRLAPRTIIVPPPLRFSTPTVCSNPVGQNFDGKF